MSRAIGILTSTSMGDQVTLTSTVLAAEDGVRLDARHDPATTHRDFGIVVAHGFSGSWRRPAVRRVVSLLTDVAGVISFDFRGHGRSSGVSTVGDREVLDVDAAVRWAHALGYTRVATVGFSMGASVVIRHAALHSPVAAVVAVSGASRWYYRGTAPMRRLHWVVERRVGRLVGRLALGTRVSSGGWDPLPRAPDEVVGLIAPTPLLVVHGDSDRYFPIEHGEALYAAAGQPKELWIETGFGHAENAASDELIRRIGTWLTTHATVD